MKESIALTIVRLAALRAPRGQRDELVSEWRAEVIRELHRDGSWSVVRSAFGAFSDARARRVIERAGRKTSSDGFVGLWTESLRMSVRSLVRTPGFTAVSVLTLAIGLGSSTAIYTLLDRIVLDPLPYPDAERLVRIDNQVPGAGPDAVWALSTAQWAYYDEHATELDAIAVYRSGGGNVLTISGPRRARLVRTTRELLPLLGAEPRLGRLISEADDTPGAERVAVVSASFWRDELGGDPDAIGTTISMDGRPVVVVGVLEDDARLPGQTMARAPEVWTPLQIDRGGTFYNNHVFQAIGRLAPGSSAEAAEADFARLRDRLPERFPDAYNADFFERYGFRTQAAELRASVVGNAASGLWVLFGGVALVLLIACANVANLFLVRMESRQRELSVRVAIGADRPAITRHVLSDGLVLAGAGGTLGLLLAWAAVPAITRAAPDALPRLDGVALGLDGVLFTVVASLAVGVAVSAWPILGRGSAVGQLTVGGRGSSAGRRQNRLRGVLVVSQIALAMSLLVGAGLLLQSVSLIRASDPGFDAQGVAAIDLYATSTRYPDDVALWAFHKEVTARIAALPGVVAVGMGEEVPVSGGYGCTVQGFEDETVYDRIREAGMTTCAGQTRVTPGYFEALDIPLLEGRYLEAGDSDDPDRAAVVVSKAFADRFWPGENPLGRGIGPSGRTIPPYYHVVGVVDDVAKRADAGRPPLSDPAMAVYYPGVYQTTENRWGGWFPGTMTLLVKSSTDAGSLFPAIRRVVAEIDPEIPLSNARLMEDVVADASADVTFLSSLLMIAAFSALLLAAVGLHGVVSWVVSRRTREIGMRLAIGAHPGAVVRGVVGGTMRLAILGLMVGLPLAMLTSRVGEAVLVGVSPTDPTAYLGAVAVVTLVAALASWLPARRAASIDPATALRYD